MASVRAPRQVGFIGVGHMGGPMCRQLLRAGVPVRVHDIQRRATREHEQLGARWAETPAACAREVDVLVTMLPGPPQVEAVMLGGDVAGTLRPGSTWIDMSTSSAATAARVGKLLSARGVHRLDAPVSGMVKGAIAGQLTIFVGGEAELVYEHRPLLEIMGDPERIFHMGPHGAGYTAKIVGNLLWFAQLVATAEVLTLGVKGGVDVEVLRKTLVASPSSSTLVERDIVSIYDDDYDESFAVGLACKDLTLAVDLAREVGVPAELASLVEEIYRRASLAYGPTAGEMIPVRLYEDAAGTRLRPSRA